MKLVRTACLAGALCLAAPFAGHSQQQPASWDVEQSLGPSRTIAFETDEATWVNVAVSPDGFAQGGMSPYEAIMVATINGARYIGLDRELGSLEAGTLADLVVLDANPLDDIRNSERIGMVMVNGRLFDASTMQELGDAQRTRWTAPTLHWNR